LFCEALNVAFAPNVDNLAHASSAAALRTFENRIELWRARLLGGGLPRRASRFLTALECHDGRGISG
jgi:elongation factor P hydroxylase